MTNSVQEKPKAPTGTIPISQEKGEKFISKRDTEFEIGHTPTGLFFISMKAGGKKPPLCDELFTSYNAAKSKLELYLTTHDPLNLAVYPSKVKKSAKS